MMLALLNTLGLALLHSLWQFTLIGGVIWLLLTLTPKDKSALRFNFAFAALIALPLAFFATFAYLYASTTKTLAASSQGGLTLPTAYLAMLWQAGVVFYSLKLFLAHLNVTALRNAPYTQPSDELVSLLNRLQTKMSLKRAIDLRLTERLSSAGTIGILKPIIFLPLSCVTYLSLDEIEAILSHELAHIRRHDYLRIWAQHLIKALFFYHPVTYYLLRECERECEFACDHMATKTGITGKTLATALLKLQLPRKDGLVLNARGHRKDIFQRVERLTDVKSQKSNGIAKPLSLMMCLALLVTFIGAALTSPQPKLDVSDLPTLTRVELVALKDDVCDLLEVDKIYGTEPYDRGGPVLLTYDASGVRINNIPLPKSTQSKLVQVFQAYGFKGTRSVDLHYYRDYVDLRV